jgi:hypothetical protein
MKHFIYLLFFLSPVLSSGQSHNRIDALILGTFHMGESSDYQAGEYDDILTLKRQREVLAVVRKLATYKPDKIFVENTPEAQGFWDNVYQNYAKRILPTDESILKNEIFQLGIRTALMSKNGKGVICINYENELKPKITPDIPSWNQYMMDINRKKPTYPAFFKANKLASGTFDRYIANHNEWKKLPLKEHLIHMNEEESLRDLHYFNVLAWMDNNENGVGAELSSLEYYRNLKIVQNLYTKLDASDDRILIIYGAAHAQVISDILKSHPVFNVLDVKSVLK